MMETLLFFVSALIFGCILLRYLRAILITFAVVFFALIATAPFVAYLAMRPPV